MDLSSKEWIEIANEFPLIRMPLKVEPIALRNGNLANYSIFRHLPKEMVLDAIKADKGKGQYAVGCMIGMAMADSVAAPWRHTELKEASSGIGETCPVYSLETGQYTDNTSLVMCLAESLIVREGYEPTDARGRGYHWWHSGYCSSRGEKKPAYGLRPSMSRSFGELLDDPNAHFVKPNEDRDSASLLRAIVPPLFFHNHPEYGIIVAQYQSYGTHGNEIPAACCATLAFLVVKILQLDDKHERSASHLCEFIDSTLAEWGIWMDTQVIAHPHREIQEAEQKRDAALLEIEQVITSSGRWNWRNITLDVHTNSSQVGYSSLDALSLALHVVYHAKDYAHAVQRAIAMGGDADFIASVAGGITGAYYGYHAIIQDSIVSKWYGDLEKNERIAMLGGLLYSRGPSQGGASPY